MSSTLPAPRVVTDPDPSADHRPDPRPAGPAADPPPPFGSSSVSSPPQPQVPHRHRLELSASQIAGGALAAMTAAALGSRLGVAGTIVGAALASICAAVLGSVYTLSIRHTRDAARSALHRATPVRRTAADRGRFRVLPGTDGRRPSGRRLLIVAAVGSVAIFVVALAVIFGLETVSGRALDGQRGHTTIGQLVTPGRHAATSRFAGSSDGGPGPSADQPSAPASQQPSSGPGAGASVPSAGAAGPGASTAPTGPATASSAPAPASGPQASGTQASGTQASGTQASGTQAPAPSLRHPDLRHPDLRHPDPGNGVGRRRQQRLRCRRIGPDRLGRRRLGRHRLGQRRLAGPRPDRWDQAVWSAATTSTGRGGPGGVPSPKGRPPS